MRYIHAPWFDGLLIWSGVPIGLILATLAWNELTSLLFVSIATLTILDAAHLLSPMGLLAVHPEMRQRALAEPVKLIIIPILLLVIPALYWGKLGILAPYAFMIRGSWNAWHFASQNFGFVQIYRRLWVRPGYRRIDRLICVSIVAIVMIPMAQYWSIISRSPPPRWLVTQMMMPQWLFVFFFGVLNVNHWLSSIGLSIKVMKFKWWWLGLLVLMAVSGFAWNMGIVGVRGLNALVYLNLGVGMAHYWIDAFIWRRNEPAMRAVLT